MQEYAPFPEVDDDWRVPREYESAILDRLLSGQFTICEILRSQLKGVLVKCIDGYGSLMFKVAGGRRAHTSVRDPIEGVALDADGVIIHYLVLVSNGVLEELDVFNESLLPIRRFPSADEIKVVACHE
jgi:hypothetical protein